MPGASQQLSRGQRLLNVILSKNTLSLYGSCGKATREKGVEIHVGCDPFPVFKKVQCLYTHACIRTYAMHGMGVCMCTGTRTRCVCGYTRVATSCMSIGMGKVKLCMTLLSFLFFWFGFVFETGPQWPQSLSDAPASASPVPGSPPPAFTFFLMSVGSVSVKEWLHVLIKCFGPTATTKHSSSWKEGQDPNHHLGALYPESLHHPCGTG